MKYLLSLSFALVLLFAAATVSLAVPVVGAEEGRWAAFADYDWWAANVGAGYGLTDAVTLGAVYDATFDNFGVFADLTRDRFDGQAEIWFTGSTLVTVTGLWNFDLEPFTLGIGGGLDYGPGYADLFLAAAANLAVGKNLNLYGGVRYFPNGGAYVDPYCLKAGLLLGF